MADSSERGGLPHLHAWREWRGLSIRELSSRAVIHSGKRAGKHVSYVTISTLERGATRANWQTIAALADALGITRETLLHEDPQ